VSSPKITLPSAAPVLQLGAAADLLRGLRPTWADPTRDLGPFFAPLAQPFRTFDLASAPAIVPSSGIAWSGPVLSVHPDTGSLLDAIFAYRVLPFARPSPGFDIPARTLLLPSEGRGAALATLGAFLGLDLAAHAAAGAGFVLLKMRRVVAEHVHEAMAAGTGRRISIDDYWTAEARNAMRRLRVTRRIINGPDRQAVVSESQVGRYLDYFHRFGTHFVTRIEMGDLLLQVLALHPARSQAFTDFWQREAGGACITGVQALAFRAHLGPRWVASRGRIVSVGDNPALTASLRAGDWHDGEFAHSDSLLEALTRGPAFTRALAVGSGAPGAIAIDFAPQSSFMEVFRADAWKRLLKGAMLQRFGAGISIPPARLPPVQPVPTRDLPRGELRIANTLVRFETVVEYGASTTLQLPEARVLLCAYRVNVSPQAGQLPIIRLEQATLDDFEFIAGAMHDALFTIEAAGNRHDTICEGFRFATDPADPSRVVLRETPSAQHCLRLAPLIESAWPWMEGLRWHPGAADFARGFFEWLAAFWRGDTARQPARVRALYLARVKSFLSDSVPRGFVEPAALFSLAHDVLARAIRARVELRDPATAPEAELHACASDFAGLADRAEKLLLLSAISSSTSSAEVERLRTQMETALTRFRAAASPWMETTAAPNRAVLAALSEFFAATPEQCRPARPIEGEAPIGRLWRLLFKIRQTEAATHALELLRAPTSAQDLDQAEASLTALDHSVVPPSPPEWLSLPALLAEVIQAHTGEALPSALFHALESLAAAAKTWLEARASFAESVLQSSPGSAASESFEGSAQLRHLYEQGRLFAALLRLAAALHEPGAADARPDGFDLLAAAEFLIAAAQTKGNIQAQEFSFVKASET
jgi:ElaB/YqjD/DUF883 family membrane-anchored ribosome-binding protein